jgi:hypothetical protein
MRLGMYAEVSVIAVKIVIGDLRNDPRRASPITWFPQRQRFHPSALSLNFFQHLVQRICIFQKVFRRGAFVLSSHGPSPVRLFLYVYRELTAAHAAVS